MKFDLQLLFILVGIGLTYKQLSWRGWFAVCVLLFVWLMYNWMTH